MCTSVKKFGVDKTKTLSDYLSIYLSIYLSLSLSLYIYTYIYIYIYISAIKVNALTQINFNGTNFFNARLTQRVFSV